MKRLTIIVDLILDWHVEKNLHMVMYYRIRMPQHNVSVLYKFF